MPHEVGHNYIEGPGGIKHSLLTKLEPDRNIYGRSGRVFLQEINTTRQGNQTLGATKFLSNVTNISANLSFEKVEVKQAGERIVRYKSGAISGEGSLTFDKVSSYFEEVFLKHFRRAIGKCSIPSEPREFYLTISLEDSGIPNIEYDGATGFASSGHEQLVLMNVQFWNLPLGYDTADIVQQDIDFTFQGLEFGNGGDLQIAESNFNFDDLIKFIC